MYEIEMIKAIGGLYNYLIKNKILNESNKIKMNIFSLNDYVNIDYVKI